MGGSRGIAALSGEIGAKHHHLFRGRQVGQEIGYAWTGMLRGVRACRCDAVCAELDAIGWLQQ
ncbi:hypothetical protein XarbCFBP7604_07450 [Xanthomonas arboricola]|jgi:hypothetical protein|nr:hypothetical protein XarbCFBP7604_07450 [Xanthomonas arboricola]PPU46170.1 hypothetical protein XarbCFBP7697_10555 [Xanthomonas arboricola]